MKEYNRHILLLAERLLIALLMFFLARIFFLVLNYSHFTGLGFTRLFNDFLIGARFDLSTLVYLNLPVILLHIIPGGSFKDSRIYQTVIKYYFIIVNSLLLLINLSDARFFDFTLKRSTAYILKLMGDSGEMPSLLPRFLIDYWYVPLTWLVLTALAWYLYSFTEKKKSPLSDHWNVWQKTAYQIPAFLFMMLLTLVGARGGIQPKPLTVLHAAQYVPARETPLVLNTPFTIMHTLKYSKGLDMKAYFTPDECQKIFPTQHKYDYPDSSFRKINIVVILLESFSREYSGYLNDYKGYMPFLDSLMQQSLLFTHAFSNGLRSIDAIPAIVSGIPDLMENPFIFSVYNTNYVGSLAEILNEKGYETAFFHGGNNGTMSFDAFANLAGFDGYYGHTEYKKEYDDSEKYYDGYWGVYDHAYLPYVAWKLNTFRQPFFALEFTLSSHNPYKVPDDFKEKFPETDVKILRVIRYTDYALRQFFKEASKMPWFKNTLFVISADHPGHSFSEQENSRMQNEDEKLSDYDIKYYHNTAGSYAIPILFYFPGDSLYGTNNSTMQQSDIMPSVLDYMKCNSPFMAFGSSVFSDSGNRVAFQYVSGFYQIIRGDYNLLFDGTVSLALFNNRKDPEHLVNLLEVEPEKVREMEPLIKAVVQQYNLRMENNRLDIE